MAGIVGYVVVINFGAINAWFGRLAGYLSPFFAGAIIAYLLDIPCFQIEKMLRKIKLDFFRKRARGISIILTLSICSLLMAIFVRMLIPQLTKSTADFIQNFPFYYENVLLFFGGLEDGALYLGLENALSNITTSWFESLSQIDFLSFNFIWDSIRKVLGVSTYMVNIVLAIVTSIYLLFEKKNMLAFFKKVFYAFYPEKSRDIVARYFKDANDYVKKFMYCNTLDGVIVGVASVIGIAIVGVPYAVILGIIEGVTNMIPYFGAIAGSVLVSLIVLVTDGFTKALIVGIFLFVLQMIDGNVIKPKLYGGSFKVSPFVVILSITLGGIYYGVLGMILAIPVVAIIKNIINDILEYRIKQKEAN